MVTSSKHIALVGTFGFVAGCAPLSDPTVSEQPATEATALGGRTDYEAEGTNQCSPYMTLLIERASWMGRVNVASRAFRMCLENTMNDRYLPCNEDTFGPARPRTITAATRADRAARYARAIDMLSGFNNLVTARCDLETWGPRANVGTYGSSAPAAIRYGGDYHESRLEWTDAWGLDTTVMPAIPDPDRFMEPWQFHAGDSPHEFAHIHGYDHPDAVCEVGASKTGVGISDPTTFSSNRRFRMQIDGGPLRVVTLTGGMTLGQVISQVNATFGFSATYCERNPCPASDDNGQLRLSGLDFKFRLYLRNLDPGTLEALGFADPSITPSNCADARCSWISGCGGTGTPPTTRWSDYEGLGYRNFCVWHHTEGASSSGGEYVSRGEPSLPYIVSDCVAYLMTESQRVCSRVIDNPSCQNGELMLLNSWSGVLETPQSGGCSCVPDPQHLVVLSSAADGVLTAWNGGGEEIAVNVTQRIGPWQTFYAIDPNRGAGTMGPTDSVGWSYGDPIQLKTHGGPWVGPDFTADSVRPSPLWFEPSSGAGRVRSGDSVYLRSNVFAPWYAMSDGFQLARAFDGPPTFAFDLQIYRREHMVYLQSPISLPKIACGVTPANCKLFVAFSPTRNGFYADMQNSTLRDVELDVETHAQKRRAAFWLIDWNGGSIESGDSISFESIYDDAWHYLSTATASTSDALRRIHSVAAEERFTISKVRGSLGTQIVEDDVIALRSSNGNYVTVSPSSASYRVTNAGATLGSSQELTLQMVQSHDQERPTWDGQR